MSAREIAYSVIDSLSEEKIEAFITLFADENTIARFETEVILKDKTRKRYNNFDEILAELDDE